MFMSSQKPGQFTNPQNYRRDYDQPEPVGQRERDSPEGRTGQLHDCDLANQDCGSYEEEWLASSKLS
jgi:hypothetical protein